MLAKSRTDSEMMRTKCEMISMPKIGPRILSGVPLGMKLLKYPRNPFALTPWMW